MHLIEISGQIEHGMWHYAPFYPAVTVEEIPPLEWPKGKGKVYGQKITFGAQSGTYIATGAHIYSDKPTIADIPLERFITNAVIARVDVKPRGRVTLEMVSLALEMAREEVREGEALLIATGWDRYWNQTNFLTDSPGLSKDLVSWAVKRKLGILGSDLPVWDAKWEEDFWPELYGSDTLVLAPLVNLTKVPVSRAHLCALPLKIKGACGSPCRAFLQLDA